MNRSRIYSIYYLCYNDKFAAGDQISVVPMATTKNVGRRFV